MRFAKGHGTQNDFVVLPDFDDALGLTPDLVRRLCDRRAGIGADGVLRVVPADAPSAVSALHDAGLAPAPPDADGLSPEWFMDYRNSDGSLAEMCGNGIRVFTRYLLDHRLAGTLAFTVGTRAGWRKVRAEPDGSVTAEMGVPAILGQGRAVIGGLSCTGLRISMGNPHLAVLADGPVESYDLSAAPLLDPAEFPDGANVEVVRLTGDRRAEMRVYERGSGPTHSCGTGAVAAAVAAALAGAGAGTLPALVPDSASGTWAMQVPGGKLDVTLVGTAALLGGAAVIVAEGELDPVWLSATAGSRS